MSNQRQVMIFCEDTALATELITAARLLQAETLSALVVGDSASLNQLRNTAVDRIYWIETLPADFLVEDIFPTLLDLINQQKPDYILIGATSRGRLICGRLAARLNVSALTDVQSLEVSEDGLVIRHMIFAGGAQRIERPLRQPVLLTIGKGQFEPPADGNAKPAEIIPVSLKQPEKRAILRERKDLPPVSVNLADARRVICLGRGIARQEDLALAEKLANELGAEIACTRPLSEGLGWLPRERYIGISGAYIKSDLYIGLGVSGQVQHTVGIVDARVIVAVNRDPDAPIFKQADYGIVADLYEVLPVLIEAVRGAKGL
ncbi:MAG: electron transfer flavoprotein subunit alpha/FixB family protein [Bellilinea sp.]|nr:electron transfer flavoprotein subunit alpha/FixB family protein [Bellilinea sp.]